MAAKASAKGAARPVSKGKDPFVAVSSLKEVFPLYADRKTKLLALDDVPFVLRATGLSIYGEEEKKIREQVEKIDGLGKPVSFKTLSDWFEENHKSYVRSVDDAYSALGTLCHEGIIGKTDSMIVYPWLRHLVSEVGDKIKADTVDKVLKGKDGLQNDEIALDDFVKYLQK
eukprot:TRINITY_DN48009_c0_g1_i1.p1 TRINITY_DN48009_c0_g1~~TRINITY_DN48009_c0_g1_i1.p1  ORF type:complete len:195 (+),score=48.81 TRINITY_DN48009_c0_g1_i1:73-585(+)